MTVAMESGNVGLAEGSKDQRLQELETVVERALKEGIPLYVEAGKALAEIRERKLWSGHHNSFGWYLKERWGFTQGHASRLIAGAELAGLLTAVKTPIPESHAAMRELVGVWKEHGAEAAEQVARNLCSPGVKPATARKVRDTARGLGIRRASAKRRRAFGRSRFTGEIANMLVTLTFDVRKSRPRLVEAGIEEWTELTAAVRGLLKEIASAKRAWADVRTDREGLEDVVLPASAADEPPAEMAALPA